MAADIDIAIDIGIGMAGHRERIERIVVPTGEPGAVLDRILASKPVADTLANGDVQQVTDSVRAS